MKLNILLSPNNLQTYDLYEHFVFKHYNTLNMLIHYDSEWAGKKC